MKTATTLLSLLIAAAVSPLPAADPTPAVPSSVFLGQPPPGDSPERFAPGIAAGPAAELFAPGIISATGDEAMLRLSRAGIAIFSRSPRDFEGSWLEIPVLRSERCGGGWTAPAEAGKPGRPWYLALDGAGVGAELFFAWTLELDGSGSPTDIDIWSVTMTPTGWSSPRRLAAPINVDAVDSWPSAADSGALYFFSTRAGGMGRGDLYRAVGVDGDAPDVHHLGGGINSPAMEHDPCVSPDERFLIFASDRPGGHGRNDLYVSFAGPTGSWTEPVNLGPAVNSAHDDARPVLSDDGATLFFTRQSEAGMDIYHIPTSLLAVDSW